MKLLFPDGDHAPALLNPGANRIGSAADGNIVLSGPCMPMLAAEIEVAGRYIHLHPRANVEIILNDRRISGLIALRNGDQIRIGGVRVNVVNPATKPSVDDRDAACFANDGNASTRKPTAAPEYVLRGLTGVYLGRLHPLTSSLVIGRDPECQIVLAMPDISRRHVELRQTAHGVVVEDLGSKNGVFINEVRVHRGVLRIGDELRLATTSFLMCPQPTGGFSMPANRLSARLNVRLLMPERIIWEAAVLVAGIGACVFALIWSFL